MKFAKLFDTPDGQLLATKEFNDTEPGTAFQVVIRGEGYRGADPSIMFGWPTEEERDEAFEELNQTKAEGSAAQLAATVRNFMRGETVQ